MKKLISTILAIAFMLSAFTFWVSANQSTSNAPTISKSEFAQQCREKIKQNKSRSVLSEEETDNLIMLYTSGSNPEYYEKLLNDAGLYVYSSTVENSSARSDSNQVVLNKASLVYNGVMDNWTITAMSYWKDLSGIKDDVGLIIPITGREYDVGGNDAVGLWYYNVSGITPTLTETFAYVFDSNSSDPIKYVNPSTYDDRYGIAYTYQDKIKVTGFSGLSYNYNYFGSDLYVLARYDSSFEDFSGSAKMMYTHTKKNSQINSISTTINGFVITYSTTTAGTSFTVYSNIALNF